MPIVFLNWWGFRVGALSLSLCGLILLSIYGSTENVYRVTWPGVSVNSTSTLSLLDDCGCLVIKNWFRGPQEPTKALVLYQIITKSFFFAESSKILDLRRMREKREGEEEEEEEEEGEGEGEGSKKKQKYIYPPPCPPGHEVEWPNVLCGSCWSPGLIWFKGPPPQFPELLFLCRLVFLASFFRLIFERSFGPPKKFVTWP